MILKALKSNRQSNLLLFPVIGVVFWLKSLLLPFTYDFYAGEDGNILFKPIYSLVEHSAFLQVLFSLVLVILIAALIQLVNDRYSFIRIRTKLPPILYVLVIAGFTGLQTMHPVYFAAFFLMAGIYNLFGTFEQNKPYSQIFNAGFFVGLGCLFYLNLIILFPAFLIGTFILSHENNWRSMVILFLGLFVPILLAFSYTVFTEQTSEMMLVLEQNINTPVNHFKGNIPLHGFLLVLVILTLTGSIKIIQQYDTKKVSTRKYFTLFLIIFIFSILSFSFIPVTSQEMLVITAIPVTYLMSNLFVFMKSKFWSELLFILLLSIVIFMQFSDNIVN